MKTLIIYAHLYDKSFNSAILEVIKNNLKNKNTEYEVIDLYKDNFDPKYSLEELELYNKGDTKDKLVIKYQDLLKNSSNIIFIAPIWWSDVPAILKGFFDKVMKFNFAYTKKNNKLIGLLTNIKKATFISTSSAPTIYYKCSSRNGIKNVFLNTALRQVGVSKRKWINCGGDNIIEENKRNNFLNKLAKTNF